MLILIIYVALVLVILILGLFPLLCYRKVLISAQYATPSKVQTHYNTLSLGESISICFNVSWYLFNS